MTTAPPAVDGVRERALTAVTAARDLSQPAFIHVVGGSEVVDASGAAPDGPMSGWTFAVKDNIDVEGVPTTAACPARDVPAVTNAFAVQRFVDAGAVSIGKTNMDQFATGLVGTRSPYGACHSVFSERHVSGGSSSGSAVAVAAGVVDVALGTDTAGSGRVPAAFNGIVGVKPTRGLVSTRGVFPACPSLDCVSIFSRTVHQATVALDVLAVFDPDDPHARPRPPVRPAGVAARMTVVGVPAGELDLSPEHRTAWEVALAEVRAVVRTVPVDVTPMLRAARMLYEPPLLAERLAAFGDQLEPDGRHLDPVVRAIVLGARGVPAEAVYEARERLGVLRRHAAELVAGVDAVLLPTTPEHPTLAAVAADPVGVNARLGTYTNMANLLDLCGVAVPMPPRRDGLPFGVQLLAPAFADLPLLELAARLVGERVVDEGGPPPAAGRALLAVCGAHLSGLPLNGALVGGGGRLHRRAQTAAAYRMVEVPGRVRRPALVAVGTGRGSAYEVEVWDVPEPLLDRLRAEALDPLVVATVHLDDGTTVPGYVGRPDLDPALPAVDDGWRAHLRTSEMSR